MKSIVGAFFAIEALKRLIETIRCNVQHFYDLAYPVLAEGVQTGNWKFPLIPEGETEIIFVLEAPCLPPRSGPVTKYVNEYVRKFKKIKSFTNVSKSFSLEAVAQAAVLFYHPRRVILTGPFPNDLNGKVMDQVVKSAKILRSRLRGHVEYHDLTIQFLLATRCENSPAEQRVLEESFTQLVIGKNFENKISLSITFYF